MDAGNGEGHEYLFSISSSMCPQNQVGLFTTELDEMTVLKKYFITVFYVLPEFRGYAVPVQDIYSYG